MRSNGRTAVGALAAAIVLFLPPPEARAVSNPPFEITPSDVRVPDGVAPGQFQRTTRPFGDWTLICDENLASARTTCNVRQVVSDQSGALVFSWALALTQDGDPYMILRTAPIADGEGVIALSFEGRSAPIEVYFDGCNAAVCVGTLPVGPIMRGAIQSGAAPIVTYPLLRGGDITVQPTLAGLADALAQIE